MSVVAAIMVPHPPILLPEVGRGEEKILSATAESYERAAAVAAELKPETIVLASPHAEMYADYFHISPGKGACGDMGRFRAGQLRFQVRYDTRFADMLSSLAEAAGLPAGTLGERSAALDHGTMIPLYFIDHYWRDYELVRIGLSGLPFPDHYRLGQLIAQTAERLGRRVLFIGSGDLSHKLRAEGPYGYAQEGPRYDERIMDVMSRAAFDELLDFDESFCEKAAECGHRSFCILAGALDGKRLETSCLSHEGPFGVGYGICTYQVLGDDPGRKLLDRWEQRHAARLMEKRAREDEYVKFARQVIRTWVKEKKRLSVPPDISPEMLHSRAGVFVSLHKDGRLRGCIGTIQPVRENIAGEIRENAISAAARDPRFPPVRAEELESLEISVDILSDTERITGPAQLDVRRYGVIVSKGTRRGLLLPNLDGVETVEQQVSIAMRKAGIGRQETDVVLERFEVVRHE